MGTGSGSDLSPKWSRTISLELGQPTLGDDPDRLRQLEDRGIREPVVDEEALLAALDQAPLAEPLEVLRGVRHRDPGLARQRVDGALTLGEQLEDLQAVRAGERLPDAGELAVEAILEGAMRGGIPNHKVINRILEAHQAVIGPRL